MLHCTVDDILVFVIAIVRQRQCGIAWDFASSWLMFVNLCTKFY